MAAFRITICVALSLLLLTSAGVAVQRTDSLKAGKAELQSAGALAFGPDGVLFVGDSMGGKIYALDTEDRTPSQATAVDVPGMSEKIAAMLGTTADQIQVNDVAVNPVSKKAYVSVSRGLGPTASAVIARIDSTGKIEALPLDNIKHASVNLPNPVNASAGGRGGNARLQAITDLAFVDNRVFVPVCPMKSSLRLFVRFPSRSTRRTKAQAWRSGMALTIGLKRIHRSGHSSPTR